MFTLHAHVYYSMDYIRVFIWHLSDVKLNSLNAIYNCAHFPAMDFYSMSTMTPEFQPQRSYTEEDIV